MRRVLLMLAGLALLATTASAQTAEDIVAKYIKTVGGADKIQAVKTLRKMGTYNGGGGFEAPILEENKRNSMVRQEFSLQGLTAVNAYDGHTGWKIEPWQGKKDAEPLGEEEMKVKVRKGVVVEISKHMDPAEADGENVGIVKFGPSGAALLIEHMNALVEGGNLKEWAPRAFGAFAQAQPLHAISTRGFPWIEIDFPADYACAREKILPELTLTRDRIKEPMGFISQVL